MSKSNVNEDHKKRVEKQHEGLHKALKQAREEILKLRKANADLQQRNEELQQQLDSTSQSERSELDVMRKDKESLEKENLLLKEENERLQMNIANPHKLNLMNNSMFAETVVEKSVVTDSDDKKICQEMIKWANSLINQIKEYDIENKEKEMSENVITPNHTPNRSHTLDATK